MKYIKIISILLIIVTIQTAFSNDLLHCLGQEELRIHKQKDDWHNYKLNQEIINELTKKNEVKFTQRVVDQVCNTKYPTLKFVQLVITEKKQIVTKEALKAKLFSLNELTHSVTQAFFRYLANIEAISPTPRCLDMKIPGISKIKSRYIYLEKYYTTEKLLPKKEVDIIFNKLVHIKDYFKECEQSKKK